MFSEIVDLGCTASKRMTCCQQGTELSATRKAAAGGLRLRYLLFVLVTCWSVGAWARPEQTIDAQEADPSISEQVALGGEAMFVPLRLPLLAIMLGGINTASASVFQAATQDEDLSEEQWLDVGRAAIDLVGDATLITLPGTGPNDPDWVIDERWRQFSLDMQEAGFAVGSAANANDRAALTDASARLAQSCQSCHLVFSPHLVTSPP